MTNTATVTQKCDHENEDCTSDTKIVVKFGDMLGDILTCWYILIFLRSLQYIPDTRKKKKKTMSNAKSSTQSNHLRTAGCQSLH